MLRYGLFAWQRQNFSQFSAHLVLHRISGISGYLWDEGWTNLLYASWQTFSHWKLIANKFIINSNYSNKLKPVENATTTPASKYSHASTKNICLDWLFAHNNQKVVYAKWFPNFQQKKLLVWMWIYLAKHTMLVAGVNTVKGWKFILCCSFWRCCCSFVAHKLWLKTSARILKDI